MTTSWAEIKAKRRRQVTTRGMWRARAQRRTVFLALICAAGAVAQSRWLFLPMVLWLWLYVTELNEDES